MPTLGYVFDGNGIHLHPSKIKGITNLSFPASSTQMKSFLGMCNFARNALQNYAEKVAPLDAVSLQRTIVPNETLLKAFADAKRDVTNAATLVTEGCNQRYPVCMSCMSLVARHTHGISLVASSNYSRSKKTTSSVLSYLLRDCSFSLQRHQGSMLVRRYIGL
jgi:hypothetical protein